MNEQQLKNYINELNDIEGTIKFTHEFEQNKELNSLDTKLKRLNDSSDSKLKIRWFRKDTAADRLLIYESSHGKSIKTNIVKNMTTRILETTQNSKDQEEDMIKLKNMLLNSNCPVKEIEKLMKNTCEEFKSNNDKSNNISNLNKYSEEIKHILSLPYALGMEVLKRELEKK